MNKLLKTIRTIRHLPSHILQWIVSMRIRHSITLIGTGHQFRKDSRVVLSWGSTKEDVVMMDHAELLNAKICSYNHGKVTMGNWAKIGRGSVIDCVNSVFIDDDAAISRNVTIIDNNSHPLNPDDRRYMRHTPHGSRERQPMYAVNAPIHIGKNVLVGEYSRICKGVTIGDNSIIGANSIVTKSIPANCIAVGNPARVVKEDIDKTTTPVFPLS